jgi:PKD repeat protein
LIISTNSPLSASSIAGPQAGDAPLAVGFSSSAAGGVSPYAFAWNFGDGSTSTTQNPSHTYITAGIYTVTLTVTDALSEVASARTLTVSISPELRVTSAVNANSGRTPLAVTFTGTPAGGMAPYTYAWTFGDGATSGVQNPTYTYTSGGTFNANLTITDANHATSSASTLTITAIAALNASAGALPAIGDAPLTTTLNVATSGGQPPYSYSWDLGDGTTSSAATLSHVYATPGSYTASITVSDGSGQVSHTSALITVYSALAGSGSAAPTSGTGSLQVSFSASATGGLRPYTFAWTFGDGVNAATPNGTHVYGPGTFHPTLTIRDSSGGSWSGSVGIITVASPPALVPTPAAIGGQEPSPTAATPVESPSPPSSSSPPATSQASPPAPPAASDHSPAGGTGGSPIRAWLMVLGSLFAAGLGGTLFRFWIRHRG